MTTNNNRLARGAGVLRNQVLAKFPGTEWNGSGEPDGFGVFRSIWFAGDAAAFLAEVLPHIEDSRIATFEHSKEDGVVTVHFVQTNDADQVHDFPLDAGAVVAGVNSDPVRPDDDVTAIEGLRIEAQSQDSEPEPLTEPEPVPEPALGDERPDQAPLVAGEPVTPTGDGA